MLLMVYSHLMLPLEIHKVNIQNFWLPLVVNNAGVGLIGPIECQSIEEMKAIMETNFFGVVRMIKEVLPDMKKRRSGHIVVISSVMGVQGKLSSREQLRFIQTVHSL